MRNFIKYIWRLHLWYISDPYHMLNCDSNDLLKHTEELKLIKRNYNANKRKSDNNV